MLEITGRAVAARVPTACAIAARAVQCRPGVRHLFLRPGLPVRRRWLYVGAFGAAAIIGYWLLMLRGDGPVLRLMTLAPEGGFAEAVRVPDSWADTVGLVAGAVVRVPLVLAVANVGGEEVVPGRLELSVPTRIRLVRNDGRPLVGELSPGSPLVRYEVPATLPRVPPGGRPVPLVSLDTLWLEPVIPAFYCLALGDSVPDFVPAPPAPVEAIARVRIFYSFDDGDLDRRQTGLLTVQLDPALLKREAPTPPPIFPAEYREPRAPMPELGALSYRGYRRAYCGEPDLPLELLSTLWETPNGGRFFVIDHGGAPRKYLFDMDRDSIIELELWDPDGDGDFETRRAARLPIPAFLMPPPLPVQPGLAFLDSIPEDQLAPYDRYGPMLTRPYEPRTAPPDTAPRIARFRPRILEGGRDTPGGGYTWRPTGRVDAAAPAASREQTAQPPHTGDRPAPGQPSPDRERDGPRPVGKPVAPPEPTGEDRTPAAGEDTSRPKPKKPEQTPPRLLGRPVDSIAPAPRPDTTGIRR